LTKQWNHTILHARKNRWAFFPLFTSQIPAFDESIEKYATDLKKEAKRGKIKCCKL